MKKLNINLLKALVETDFSLLSPSKVSKRVDLRAVASIVASSKVGNKTVSLDLQELIKNLKQTVRLLQFVRSKDLNQIYICSSNKQHLNLLGSELDGFQKKGKVTVGSRLEKVYPVSNSSQLLLLLENTLGNKKRIFKKLFEDKIYLVNKVNSKIESNSWGTYKIYNDLQDFKKLIFLIAVLRQVLQ
jgi:hypothetical protein